MFAKSTVTSTITVLATLVAISVTIYAAANAETATAPGPAKEPAAAKSVPATAAKTTTLPVKIETLSPAQRTSMPDATAVMLPTGKPSTLGVLRAAHKARLARFNAAKGLGAKLLAGATQAAKNNGVLVQANIPAKMALDYEDFCIAAKSSGCLYFPGPASILLAFDYGANEHLTPGLYYDYDPLVTDAGVCASQFGQLVEGACYYPYPGKYTANFNPGPPVSGQPIGSGVTSSENCPAPLNAQIDPHGAIVLSASTDDLETTAVLSCVVWVYAPPPV